MNIPKEKSIESGISSDGDDSKFRTGGDNENRIHFRNIQETVPRSSVYVNIKRPFNPAIKDGSAEQIQHPRWMPVLYIGVAGYKEYQPSGTLHQN